MKLLIVTFLLSCAIAARAQSTADGVIKVTVTMLSDGRHKNTILNPDTHTAEETIEDNKGKVLSKTVYALNDRNVPGSATFFDGKGKMLYKATYTRDAGDRITEEAYTSITGKSLGRRTYGYGANNRVSSEEVYDANGNLITSKKPTTSGRPARRR